MHDFLVNNRAELIERCKAKVAERPPRATSPEQLASGVPLFLEQLTRTLGAEAKGHGGESVRISGKAGGGSRSAESEMGVSATAYGKQLVALGYTVDDVVHGYGDVCQSISDMAVERDAPFKVEEFRTLNRCLDNVIAEAVTAFSIESDGIASQRYIAEANQRLGFLLHELRNSLQTTTLAIAALETGQLPISGATGVVLKRSVAALTSLVKHALDEVRAAAVFSHEPEVLPVASLVAEVGSAALLDANARGCAFVVRNTVDAETTVKVDRERVHGALMNVVQNAFKFTRPGTEVSLGTRSEGDAVVIEVQDCCGGLAPGVAEIMFEPFTRGHPDKSGLGLGLSISKQNVEASGGSLTVRNLPGSGCVFTIRLPRHESGVAAQVPHE